MVETHRYVKDNYKKAKRDSLRLIILMIRFILFSLFYLAPAITAYAQESLTGRIYEDQTSTLLPGIVVRNLRTDIYKNSDQTGSFSIPTKVGDLVTFTGFSYHTDTLYVKDLNYIEVMLVLKSKTLAGVTIRDQETKLGGIKVQRTLSPIGNDAVVYSRDDAGHYTGGVTANIFDSHSAQKKRDLAVHLEKDGSIKDEIAGVFSPGYLKNYLPIKDQELTNFIVLYTPNVATYTSHSFNLAGYLNTCYKEFLKIPEEKRRSKELIELNRKSD